MYLVLYKKTIAFYTETVYVLKFMNKTHKNSYRDG